MKKKIVVGLILIAFAGGVTIAYMPQPLSGDIYRCQNGYCPVEKEVTIGAKAPSNTGLCRYNPSKLSTAHDFKQVWCGVTSWGLLSDKAKEEYLSGKGKERTGFSNMKNLRGDRYGGKW